MVVSVLPDPGLPELPRNFGDLMLANEKQTHVRPQASVSKQ